MSYLIRKSWKISNENIKFGIFQYVFFYNHLTIMSKTRVGESGSVDQVWS